MQRKAIIAKRHRQERRAIRTRAKIQGTATCPRLTVFRSDKHISAQLINDELGRTLAAATDMKSKEGKPIERAATVGTLLAEAAKAAGVTKVVFDRGSFRYHGRVKALADAARASGLEF
ncbi:MAG: 50S ribosomal protein L18 [Candidatus Uhrbacteria bacterium]|nr:50S ribosomal protein L18 [Candidatus Uhrbacteria bacterium]